VFLRRRCSDPRAIPSPSAFFATSAPATSRRIIDLYRRGDHGGCAAAPLLPDDPNLRGEMAVFLGKTFLQ
jgi:hypothetical protein